MGVKLPDTTKLKKVLCVEGEPDMKALMQVIKEMSPSGPGGKKMNPSRCPGKGPSTKYDLFIRVTMEKIGEIGIFMLKKFL